jgi:hypothetical protein
MSEAITIPNRAPASTKITIVFTKVHRSNRRTGSPLSNYSR